MALARVPAAAVTTPRACINSVSLQCITCVSPYPSSHTPAVPLLDFASAALNKSRGTSSIRNGPQFGVSRIMRYNQLGCENGGLGFQVRAQAKFDTAFGADENGRKGRAGEQDNQKATALKDSTIYPIMRVYRIDLCTLEITGDAQAWQATEAMAADGGLTAAEELSKGRPLMTVETIIPGRSGDHSTVSTKLLAPTHTVNRAAKTTWVQRNVSMSSGNALAKAFQRVVMQHLLSFDIHIRSPGTARDMAKLADEKEDAVMAGLESRDPKVLEGFAQVVSSYCTANMKDTFDHRFSKRSRRHKRFTFWRKPEWFWASNKAIGIRPLSQSEIMEQAKRILDEKNALAEIRRTHQAWWPTPSVSLPPDILPDHVPDSWIREFIPMHKVQIDTSKLKVIAKGWQPTKTEQVIELCLTHSQLVDAADMLDLYYEDKYTTPAKALVSGVDLKVSHISQSKVAKTVWTLVLSCIAGGVLLVGLLAVAKLKASSSTKLLSSKSSVASAVSRTDSSFTNKWCRVRTDRQALLPKNEGIPAEEMESLCHHVVSRLKDAFNLNGEVESSPDRGAWIGVDLSQWGRTQNTEEAMVGNADRNGRQEVIQDVENQPNVVKDSGTNSVDDILRYQVVLTRDGKVVGFQPGNKAAVGFWADFPFAKELHKGRRLGAGLFERGLKYADLSEEVVAIELLCEESSSPAFTARPLQL
ncbi:unnamed protein product [Calypogeia fissa]